MFIRRDEKGKITHRFMTDDIVKAEITKGKYTGQYTCRIAIRNSVITNSPEKTLYPQLITNTVKCYSVTTVIITTIESRGEEH